MQKIKSELKENSAMHYSSSFNSHFFPYNECLCSPKSPSLRQWIYCSHTAFRDLQERIQCGQHVRISFGTRTMTGFVFLSKLPHKKIKPISTIIDEEPIFTTEMMNVLQWIADYYIAPLEK